MKDKIHKLEFLKGVWIYKAEEVNESDFDFVPCMKKPIPIHSAPITEPISVVTKEGEMRGNPGDRLMKGVEKELYVCGGKIYAKTYEEVK